MFFEEENAFFDNGNITRDNLNFKPTMNRPTLFGKFFIHFFIYLFRFTTPAIHFRVRTQPKPPRFQCDILTYS